MACPPRCTMRSTSQIRGSRTSAIFRGALIYKAQDHTLRLSETFDDGDKLLASCEQMGLEGIVSKRRDFPYRSGTADWVKVKCASWREANKDRGELFNRDK